MAFAACPKGPQVQAISEEGAYNYLVISLRAKVQLSASSSLDISIPSLSLTEGKLSEKLTISVGDSEKQGINGSKKYLQPTVASLEIKLKDAEEERYRIKKELEDLMEKHSILQTDFLKEKEGEFISHQDRYKKLQKLESYSSGEEKPERLEEVVVEEERGITVEEVVEEDHHLGKEIQTQGGSFPVEDPPLLPV
ncbi:Coiled-coil domain-containing protein 91 [Chelonia mydas]|uniref:Coiled-coil domain-containing protein 91 n=1 Tax=Chelonia mydas TaxID=8469 RepID=M7BKP9_CHEMY|nr:Coiled-coil domain-containing protein 91 [Chelonia mydas]